MNTKSERHSTHSTANDSIGYEHRERHNATIKECDDDIMPVKPDTREPLNGQVFSMRDFDPALDEKMRLLNSVTTCHSNPVPSVAEKYTANLVLNNRGSKKSAGQVSTYVCSS